MKTALIRLCRCFDPNDIIADDVTPRTVYDRGALVEHPNGIRVEIDHDDDRVVGRVRELSIGEDVFRGERTSWHLALVDGDFPEWVKAGTGVSIGSVVMHRLSHGRVERVRRTLVEEISVLSHRMTPKNVGAQVIRVGPFEHRATSAARAKLNAALDDEAVLASFRLAELRQSSPGLLYRPAIGRVVGFR